MSLKRLWLQAFLLAVEVNEQEYIEYVNRHVSPASGLPQLDLRRLERWLRLGLLVPVDGQYEETDLPRTIALLVYERLVDKHKPVDMGKR
jgi:hypothetical protein